MQPMLARVVIALTTSALAATGIAVSAPPAGAVTTMSTRYLLNHLERGTEHPAGYERSKFTLWTDADGDGCDARDEVLVAEAGTKPPGGGCSLSGGRWRSKYDGLVTRDASTFDIDHMVPLNEAWQSGAWSWSAATRKAYANDLGYNASLIAVSAHSNRSKGDREPQDWMPEKSAYGCTYAKQWVAVKWRWHLSVSAAERRFLAAELATCGWPRVTRPSRPAISTGTVSPTPTPTPTATATVTSGPQTVGYSVHPGAFCSEHGWYGYTSLGTLMRCTITSTDSSYRWRSA